MIPHDHTVTVCANCVCLNLRLAARRLAEHNSTLLVSDQTLFAQLIIEETLELIDNATSFLSPAPDGSEA